MLNLIKFTNFIKDLKEVDTRKAVKLPKIALIGSPSCGKSTLIEAIVGFSFIPKSRPLRSYKYLEITLQYYHELEIIDHFGNKLISIDDLKAKFKDIYDSLDINTKDYLKLTIKSPHVPNITLYELSGLSPLTDHAAIQPLKMDLIENEIIKKKATKSVLKDESVLILCLLDSSEDVSKSIALDLSREYDPKSERTLGILTKNDLNTAENTIKINKLVNGIEHPLKHGYIEVSPLSILQEIERYNEGEDKNLVEVNDKINNELKKKRITSWNMENLIHRITKVIYHSMRSLFTSIYRELGIRIHNFEEELYQLGDDLQISSQDKDKALEKVWELINSFSFKIREEISGHYIKNTAKKRTTMLCIGATMRQLFHNTYAELSKVNDFSSDLFPENEIIKIIKRSDNATLDGFISLYAFKYVIQEKLSELKPISLEVLQKATIIINEDMSKVIIEVFGNFPNLVEFLENSMKEFLEKLITKTKKIMIKLLEANTDYIFSGDPNFLKISIVTSRPHATRAKTPNQDFKSIIDDIALDESIIASQIRENAICYYKSVINLLADLIPRTIGKFFLSPIQTNLQTFLLDKINNEIKKSPQLLDIDKFAAANRQHLTKVIEHIRKLRTSMLRDINVSTFLRQDGFIDNIFTRVTKLKDDFLLAKMKQQYEIATRNLESDGVITQISKPQSVMQRFKNWINGTNKKSNMTRKNKSNKSSTSERNNNYRIGTRARSQSKEKNISGTEERANIIMISDFVVIDDFFSKDKEKLFTKTDWLRIIDKGDFTDYPMERVNISIQNGIPQELRPSIWLLLAKVKEMKKKYPRFLYEKMQRIPNKWDDLIDKDVDRMNGFTYFVKEECRGKEKLNRILRAYANFDPELGYTQGMHAIAATILMTMCQHDIGLEHQNSLAYVRNAEKNTFWLFIYIMNGKNWRYLFIDHTPKLVEYLDILETKIKKDLPEIHQLMENNGFLTYALFSHYFLTLFTYDCPFEFTKRFFDVFLIRDEIILFDVIMKFLESSKKDILNMNAVNSFRFIKYEMMGKGFERYSRELNNILII